MRAIVLISTFLIMTLLFVTQKVNAHEVFRVEKATGATVFIINKNHYTARDSCPDVKRGDPVRFTEGSPSGFCISSVFVNMRTGNECSVWCH